jgi:hypothetical protein
MNSSTASLIRNEELFNRKAFVIDELNKTYSDEEEIDKSKEYSNLKSNSNARDTKSDINCTVDQKDTNSVFIQEWMNRENVT